MKTEPNKDWTSRQWVDWADRELGNVPAEPIQVSAHDRVATMVSEELERATSSVFASIQAGFISPDALPQCVDVPCLRYSDLQRMIRDTVRHGGM